MLVLTRSSVIELRPQRKKRKRDFFFFVKKIHFLITFRRD